MVNTLHLSFLREKIEDIRSALFFSRSESVLKLPNSLVSALQVDEIGNIWLLAPRPKQQLKEFEQRFPVQLNFYQKGKEFYLNVAGNARIVLEPSELDEMLDALHVQKNILKKWILIKVQITDAQYHSTVPVMKNNWLTGFYAQVNKWLFPNLSGYTTYNV
jgi:hypothetical protein